jgi:hypothetical protein
LQQTRQKDNKIMGKKDFFIKIPLAKCINTYIIDYRIIVCHCKRKQKNSKIVQDGNAY